MRFSDPSFPPFAPGEEVPMPENRGMLFSLLGLLETLREFGPCEEDDFFSGSESEREAANWIARHQFFKIAGGLVHLTGTGMAFLRQLEIAADSLSRQFRPSELPAPDPRIPCLN